MLFNGNQIKIDAYKKLIELGIFIPMANVELYHGRVNKTGDEWQVIKNFDNAGNKTGNHNLNKIPALNVADKKIAEEFAQERAYEIGAWRKDVKPEVHRIISSDPYAVIVDLTKRELLNQTEVKNLLQTLMSPSISKTAVKVPFNSKKIFERVSYDFNRYHLMCDYLSDKLVQQLIEKENYGEKEQEFAIEIAKAVNSHVRLMENIVSSLKMYISNNLELPTVSKERVSFSSSYFSSFMADNHIVGIFQMINSATLGKEVGAYQLFDLNRINTEKVAGEQLRQAVNTYEPVSRLIQSGINSKETEQMLSNSPEAIIRSVVEKSPIIKAEFEGDLGLWEKFNLGEHTESVMRFFEENFAAMLPYNTKVVINLIILMHDIGKASSLRNNIKRNSKKDVENYKKYARILCEDLDIAEKFANFAIDFTTKTQICTSAYYVNNDDSAISKLETVCENLLKQYGLSNDKNIVYGLMQIARILQTCDSGAYTLYGRTRKWNTKIYYNNGNETWTKGFVKTEQGYRFKKDTYIESRQNIDTINSRL